MPELVAEVEAGVGSGVVGEVGSDSTEPLRPRAPPALIAPSRCWFRSMPANEHDLPCLHIRVSSTTLRGWMLQRALQPGKAGIASKVHA